MKLRNLKPMTPALAASIAAAKARVLIDASRPCPVCGHGWRTKCGRVCGLRELAQQLRDALQRDREQADA